MSYEPHPELSVPDGSALVLRYFELDKFEDLLATSKLYWRRADCFQDEREGLPSPSYEAALAAAPFSEANRMMPNTLVTWFLRSQRGECYVSCWTLDPNESRRMWTEYVGSGRGVLLRSTFGALVRSVAASDERIFIGIVGYDDVLPSAIGFQSIMRKNEQYRPDQELRAFVWRRENMTFGIDEAGKPTFFGDLPPEVPRGRRVAVALQDLVTDVVMAPGAPDVYEERVRGLLESAGCHAQLSRSSCR